MIYTFYRGISAKWNTNNLVKNLNSGHRFHFLLTLSAEAVENVDCASAVEWDPHLQQGHMLATRNASWRNPEGSADRNPTPSATINLRPYWDRRTIGQARFNQSASQTKP